MIRWPPTSRTAGLDGTYTVAANVDFQRGPLIDVAAEASSAEAAINNVKIVGAELKEQLAQMQQAQGTNTSYFISADLVVAPTRATRVFSSRLRLLIAAGALGVAFVLGSAILADALTRRRRRRSAGAAHVAPVRPVRGVEDPDAAARVTARSLGADDSQEEQTTPGRASSASLRSHAR